MKKLVCLAIIACSLSTVGLAQGKDYKVAFDITSGDTSTQQKVIRWVTAITKDYPESQVEVVFYGHSLDLITKNKSVNEAAVMQLAASKKVAFRVCKIAMNKHDIAATDLIPGVVSVPDGVYELVQKQLEGWAYIKVTDQ